jgi:phosphopantothenoylcysteine decarboxylase
VESDRDVEKKKKKKKTPNTTSPSLFFPHQGLCDNLVTSVLRAWDPAKPLLVAPAMNTAMWRHPLTPRHVATLRDALGVSVVPPISKELACGDTGVGAMAAVDDVAAAVRRAAGG